MTIYCKHCRKIVYIAKLLNSDWLETEQNMWLSYTAPRVLKSEHDQTCRMQVLPSDFDSVDLWERFVCLSLLLFLAALGLHWGAYLVAACGLSYPAAYGILVPQPGITSASLALEGRFLTTEPSGRSQRSLFTFYSWTFHSAETRIIDMPQDDLWLCFPALDLSRIALTRKLLSETCCFETCSLLRVMEGLYYFTSFLRPWPHTVPTVLMYVFFKWHFPIGVTWWGL